MGKFKIPKCPECKIELKEVNEISYEYYTFNSKTGDYTERNQFGGSMDIKCGHCGSDVSEIFEEGACNYQAEKRK